MNLTWEQKLAAIQALCDKSRVEIFMRKPGDWGVALGGVGVKSGGVVSHGGMSGRNPEEAVSDAWETLTNLKPGEYIVIDDRNPREGAYLWNGFMWQPLTDEEREEKNRERARAS